MNYDKDAWGSRSMLPPEDILSLKSFMVYTISDLKVSYSD